MASARGHLPILRFLLQKQREFLNDEACRSFGASHLKLVLSACRNNHVEVVQMLLGECDEYVTTLKYHLNIFPGYLNLFEDYSRLLKELLYYDVDVNLSCDINTSLLLSAVLYSSYDTVKFMLSRPQWQVESSSVLVSGVMPYLAQTNANYVSILRLLLKHGASVNKQYADGDTALTRAVAYNRLSIVEMLLQHKARYDIGSPINSASSLGNEAIVSLLLQHGVNAKLATVVDTPYKIRHFSPMRHRAFGLDTVLIPDMESYCDDVFPQNAALTPLHLAALFKYLGVTKLLLSHGADIDAKLVNNMTPLHIAAKKGFIDIVTYLVDAGARRTVNDEGVTAADLAKKCGHLSVLDVLLENSPGKWYSGLYFLNIDRKAFGTD